MLAIILTIFFFVVFVNLPGKIKLIQQTKNIPMYETWRKATGVVLKNEKCCLVLLIPQIMHHCTLLFSPYMLKNLKSGGHILALSTLNCQHSTWLCATFSNGSFTESSMVTRTLRLMSGVGGGLAVGSGKGDSLSIDLFIYHLSIYQYIHRYIQNTYLLYTTLHMYPHSK